MKEHKLLTVREVSAILGVSEKEVLDLAEKGAIPAYKIGGLYLRFKRTQVHEFAKQLAAGGAHGNAARKYVFADRVSNFFYFNDFYILSFLLVLLLLTIILNT